MANEITPVRLRLLAAGPTWESARRALRAAADRIEELEAAEATRPEGVVMLDGKLWRLEEFWYEQYLSDSYDAATGEHLGANFDRRNAYRLVPLDSQENPDEN